MTESRTDPRHPYETRLAAANAGYEQIDARWNRVANLRLIAFIAAAAAAAWGLWGRAPLGWPLAAALLAGFIALALYHARLGRERTRLATLRAIEEEAIARIERRWRDLPEPWTPVVAADHPYAADLDIIGHASLFQLLDTTATRMGRETLAAWLLAPADAATAIARQGAVADLAPRLDERQEMELRGRAAANEEADPEPFLTWAEGPDGLANQGWLRWYAWLGPLALLALAAAERLGLTPYPLWAIPFLANLIIGSTVARRAYATIAGVVADHRAIAAYAGQIDLLAMASFSDPLLLTLHDALPIFGGHYI